MQDFLEITHTHTCRHRMFEQHAGSHTHNLVNRAVGGTLLCTRGPCPLVPLASYGPEHGAVKMVYQQLKSSHGKPFKPNAEICTNVSFRPHQHVTIALVEMVYLTRVANLWNDSGSTKKLPVVPFAMHHPIPLESTYSLRQPRLDLPLPDSSLLHNHLTSRVLSSPLLSSITPSLFHSKLKTFLFLKSYPP